MRIKKDNKESFIGGTTTNYPYIIAEIGNNHEGDLSYAKEAIYAAYEAGADAVKFQSITPEELVNEKMRPDRLAQLKKICLPLSSFEELRDIANEIGIDFGLSFFDEKSLSKAYLCDYIKIASSELTNYSLIKSISDLSLPTILSTGMGKPNEILKAVSLLKDAVPKLSVLHCVSIYPTPVNECNLKIIKWLKEIDGISAGYSDHSDVLEVSCAAAALGATVFEKHFTIDKSASGIKDHSLSSTPIQMKQFCSAIRNVHNAMGFKDPINRSKNEFLSQIELRRGYYYNRDIGTGEIINQKDLSYLRPMTKYDIVPDSLFGQKLVTNVSKHESVQYKHFKES
tara:strand:- start:96 stop:1118 length:1023 start_codon:yes stop_codon:yes gene_type:complete